MSSSKSLFVAQKLLTREDTNCGIRGFNYFYGKKFKGYEYSPWVKIPFSF